MKGVAMVKTPSKSIRMRVPENWTFQSADVASNFEAHVREQLPWYEIVTDAVAHLARHYIPEGGTVYDVGSSTGNVGHALAAVLEDRHAHLIAVEPSPEMAKLWTPPTAPTVTWELLHLSAEEVPWHPCDLVVMFLTMMFVAPARRRALFDVILSVLRPGGAIIIVDKVVAGEGYAATALWRLALAGKIENGADPADVVAKELSLAGVQRPLDPRTLPTWAVEWFRFGDFAGWLIEKKEA
jgi:tRNA (cmo5U34)-methyltransferase